MPKIVDKPGEELAEGQASPVGGVEGVPFQPLLAEAEAVAHPREDVDESKQHLWEQSGQSKSRRIGPHSLTEIGKLDM